MERMIIFLVALLLSNTLSKLRSAEANQQKIPAKCSQYVHRTSFDDYIATQECTDPSKPFCGIDKTTGYGQGCVSASQCPPNVLDTKIICDGSSPNCCCKEEEDDLDYDKASDPKSWVCNNLLYDDFWKPGCAKPELAQATICTGPSPSLPVFCATSEKNGENTLCPAEKRYCGINKNTGDIQGCVWALDCPGNVKDNGEIVCQADKPNCCCLGKTNDVNSIDKHLACNNYLNPEDISIWKQACALPELKLLKQCANPPQVSTTAKPSKATPKPKPGNINKKRTSKMEENGPTVYIVSAVVVLLVLGAIGGLVYFYYKKRVKANASTQQPGLSLQPSEIPVQSEVPSITESIGPDPEATSGAT